MWYFESVLKDAGGENMINAARLKYEMEVRHISVEDLCRELDISKSAYYRKINGKSEFTHSEIVKICEVLELDSPVGIFFAEKVS